MNRPLLLLGFACLCLAAVSAAEAKVRHRPAPPEPAPWFHSSADPDAVFVGGAYAGSDPDPHIRGALAREFGKRR